MRDGDHYVVNGTKMWTTVAHWADMMHCLVRTDKSGKKQQGISFLLIDMKTPGITVEPIVTLDGEHHINQVFFDDVRVPVENLVGAEGDGWKLAKFLLARERTSIADTGNRMRLMRQIKATVAEYGNGLPLCERILQAVRLTELDASLTALLALERSHVDEWMAGRDDGVGAPVLKVRSTELLQRMTEFWRDAWGHYGACYDPQLRKEGGIGAPEPWRQAAAATFPISMPAAGRFLADQTRSSATSLPARCSAAELRCSSRHDQKKAVRRGSRDLSRLGASVLRRRNHAIPRSMGVRGHGSLATLGENG